MSANQQKANKKSLNYDDVLASEAINAGVSGMKSAMDEVHLWALNAKESISTVSSSSEDSSATSEPTTSEDSSETSEPTIFKPPQCSQTQIDALKGLFVVPKVLRHPSKFRF